MHPHPASSRSWNPLPVLAAAVLVLAACDSPATPPGGAEVAVTLSPAGSSLDADGYTLLIDGTFTARVPTLGRFAFWLGNGPHDLALSGLAPNCVVDGADHRRIEVVDGAPLGVTFEIECTEVWKALSFTSSRDGHDEIYAIGVDDGSTVRLTADTVSASEAAWAPDGTRLAFSRDGSLYIAPATAMLSPALFRDPWGESPLGGVTWSPDGTRIGVTEFVWDGWCPEPVVWILDTVTGVRDRLANGEFPSWSPDGTRVLISYEEDPCAPPGLRAVAPDGSDPVDVTVGAGSDAGDPASGDTGGSWSPDGSRIAFARDHRGERNIYTIASDGSDLRQLTFHSAPDYDPAWSPDGRWIAFVSQRDGNAEIYLVEAGGSDPVNLTRHPADDRDPAWRPPVETTLRR